MPVWSINCVGQGWTPLNSELSDDIEEAFKAKKDMVSIDDPATGETHHYMFQSMLLITDADERQLLRSADADNLPVEYLPWRFDSDPMIFPKYYLQMNPHYSEILTMARKRGNKKTLIHDYATYTTYEFDFVSWIQTNKQTNTVRFIIPAPSDPPKDIKLKDDAVVPSELMCPISHDIMVDPVVAADGHTYERYQFERWVSGGKVVSPMTNLALNSITCYPNFNLSKIIKQFVSENAPVSKKRKKERERAQKADRVSSASIQQS